MKKLSLQWRITLMTVLLIGVTCVSMNLLLCSSGIYYMDSIADSLQDGGPIIIEGGETDSFDPQTIPAGENLTIVVSGAQDRFRATNWCITAAVVLLGGVLAYFVSGRALRPLRRFAQQTGQVDASNLSEIRLDEEIQDIDVAHINEVWSNLYLADIAVSGIKIGTHQTLDTEIKR